MEHLDLETLARLVDEVPSPLQREHLQSCAACHTELRALREQTESLGSLPAIRPPRGDWEALEARLLAEGLIDPSGVRPEGRRWGLPDGWSRLAAALVLFLGGAAVGAVAAPGAGGAGADLDGVARTVAEARTVEDAADVVRQAEQVYVDALSRYRELYEAGGGAEEDPAGRYAALEGILAASQAAVREAPTDPFLNGVLVSTLAERDATLRRISTSRDDEWF